MKDTYVDSRKLARNGLKLAIYHFVNSQVQKNIFAFGVITIEPIEVQIRSASQNDPQPQSVGFRDLVRTAIAPVSKKNCC